MARPRSRRLRGRKPITPVDSPASAWLVDKQMPGDRQEPPLLTPCSGAEEMAWGCCKDFNDGRKPTWAFALVIERHGCRIGIGYDGCRRVGRCLRILLLRVPHSLEDRCHVLVQTCFILVHYSSFRASKSLASLHSLRGGRVRQRKSRGKRHPIHPQHPSLNYNIMDGGRNVKRILPIFLNSTQRASRSNGATDSRPIRAFFRGKHSYRPMQPSRRTVHLPETGP